MWERIKKKKIQRSNANKKSHTAVDHTCLGLIGFLCMLSLLWESFFGLGFLECCCIRRRLRSIWKLPWSHVCGVMSGGAVLLVNVPPMSNTMLRVLGKLMEKSLHIPIQIGCETCHKKNKKHARILS